MSSSSPESSSSSSSPRDGFLVGRDGFLVGLDGFLVGRVGLDGFLEGEGMSSSSPLISSSSSSPPFFPLSSSSSSSSPLVPPRFATLVVGLGVPEPVVGLGVAGVVVGAGEVALVSLKAMSSSLKEKSSFSCHEDSHCSCQLKSSSNNKGNNRDAKWQQFDKRARRTLRARPL